MGGKIYALGILYIKEIMAFGDLTEVPMMPSFVRSVINLRGSMVPVIDLQSRFGKGATQISKRTGIVIVKTGVQQTAESRQEIGIIVDAVNEVLNIATQEIEPVPSLATGIRPEFINRMAKFNNRFVILLNANRVLSVDEMEDLSQLQPPLPIRNIKPSQPLYANK